MEQYKSWIDRAKDHEECLNIAKNCLEWVQKRIKENYVL